MGFSATGAADVGLNEIAVGNWYGRIVAPHLGHVSNFFGVKAGHSNQSFCFLPWHPPWNL